MNNANIFLSYITWTCYGKYISTASTRETLSLICLGEIPASFGTEIKWSLNIVLKFRAFMMKYFIHATNSDLTEQAVHVTPSSHKETLQYVP